MIIEVAINELDLAGLRLNPPKHCCWLMLWAKEFSKSGIKTYSFKAAERILNCGLNTYNQSIMADIRITFEGWMVF